MNARLPRQVHGILFDLDDTLYDRRGTFHRWSETFLRTRLSLIDDAKVDATLKWMESLDANGYGSKHAVIVALCERFPESRGTVEGFYDEFVDQVSFDPEAVALLDHLDAICMPYGVVTNGTARQMRKIAALRLEERTNTILVSEIFGAKKPSPEIFEAAAAGIGLDSASILFVGDHPVNDIEGARSTGMMTAWLHRDRTWPRDVAPADVAIDSLTDVLPILSPTA